MVGWTDDRMNWWIGLAAVFRFTTYMISLIEPTVLFIRGLYMIKLIFLYFTSLQCAKIFVRAQAAYCFKRLHHQNIFHSFHTMHEYFSCCSITSVMQSSNEQTNVQWNLKFKKTEGLLRKPNFSVRVPQISMFFFFNGEIFVA